MRIVGNINFLVLELSGNRSGTPISGFCHLRIQAAGKPAVLIVRRLAVAEEVDMEFHEIKEERKKKLIKVTLYPD